MNCDRYRKMMYLYRDGELSNREAEDLVRHLHACESCRLEHERIAKVDVSVRHLRSFVPTVNKPNALTSAILARIRSSQATQSSDLLDSLLDFFALPSVRIATASFIVLATGVFLFQYAILFSNIHSLEFSAGFQSTSMSHPETIYSVESSEAMRLARSKDIQRLIPPGQYRIVDNQILVSQSNVSSLLSSYGLRSLTSVVASSVLGIDKGRIDAIVEDVSKNYTTVTGFGQSKR